MSRKILCSITLSCIVCLNIIFSGSISYAETSNKNKEPRVNDNKSLDVVAKSGLLIEATTGKVLFQKNKDEQYAPASVTKIMTMLLTMEAVDSKRISLNDKVTVSESAKKTGGSTMLLDTGEVRTVEELLKGVAIASGNDAAVALGEYLGGSEDAFVDMMNKRCAELGMTKTTFKNCTGLPIQGHVSTANDIAIMSVELLKHPKILKYTGTYMETISEGRLAPIELVNHNKLVRFFPGCDGLKTGFTNEAMYCISATAVKNQVRMLSVIMGAPTYKVRNKDASSLMNYGFSKFENRNIIKQDSEVEKIILSKKGDKFLIALAKNDFNLTMERGQHNKIEKKVELINKKRFKKGEEIGVCKIYLNNKLCGEVKVYSDRDIKLSNLLENIIENISNLFHNSI